MSNPAGLPYEVIQVVHATDTEPETRRTIAAFLHMEDADWFTGNLVITEPPSVMQFLTTGPDITPPFAVSIPPTEEHPS